MLGEDPFKSQVCCLSLCAFLRNGMNHLYVCYLHFLSFVQIEKVLMLHKSGPRSNFIIRIALQIVGLFYDTIIQIILLIKKKSNHPDYSKFTFVQFHEDIGYGCRTKHIKHSSS
jgi:hypothetical protein